LGTLLGGVLVGTAQADEVVYRVGTTYDLATAQRGAGKFTREFRFVRDARMGPNSWYYLRVRVDIGRDRLRAGGPLVLTAAVNGLTAIQVQIARASSPACAEGIVVRSMDLFRGAKIRRKCGSSLVVESSNFVQSRSVRSGRATLAVYVSGGQGGDGAMRLLPGSGVFRTAKGPADLEFGATRGKGVVPMGKWSKLAFELINGGGRPARKVAIRAVSPEGMTIRKQHSIRGTIPAGQGRSGSVWVKPHREGEMRVILLASSATSRAGIELEFRAAVNVSETSGLGGVALAVGLSAVLLGWLWRGRLRVGG
jgi:hypothetical protein